MRSIPARDIKRRGISAVDAELVKGPVFVIKNDEPAYVVLSHEQYEELREGYEEATIARIKESLEDIEAGRVEYSTADELIEEFGLDE